MSPKLNIYITLFVVPCKKTLGIVDLQCCNYCELLCDFSSEFQSPITLFYYMDVRMLNILHLKWMNEKYVGMTIFVNLFIGSVIYLNLPQ